MDYVYVWLIRLLCWRLLFQASEGIQTEFFNVNTTWLRKTLVDKFSTIRDHDSNKNPVREFIVEWFTGMSLTVKYDKFIPFQNIHGPLDIQEGKNIIGIFPGQKGEEIDTIYMIGAYYDSRTTTLGNYPLHMNGGGVVGMLEAARLLVKSGAKPNTLLFVAFDYHFDKNRCCQGARHFVENWLPNYLQQRRSNDSIAEFGGAIILESILNHDATLGIQRLPSRDIVFSTVFREMYEGISKDRYRGEFLLMLGRTLDSDLYEQYRKMWDFVISSTSTWENVVDASRLKLYLTEISLVYSSDWLLDFIEEHVIKSDVFHFYRNHYKAVLITDTGTYRYNSVCDECMVLTQERIKFLEKTIYSVVYTMETLSYGNYAETVMSQIASDASLQKLTPTTMSHDLKECPTAIYEYSTELDLYYKFHTYWLTDAVSWRNARSRCEDEGSHLLIIHDEKDMQYFDYVFNYYYWVGANDIEEEGQWKWIDGSNVTQNLWRNCQPDDANIGEDCAVFSRYSKLVDVNCGDGFYFICACQINKTNTTTTTDNKEECFVDDYEYLQDFDLYYQIYQKDSELATQFDAVEICRQNNASLFEAHSLDDFIWFYLMFSDFNRGEYYVNASLEILNLYQNKKNYSKTAENYCIVLVKEGYELSLSLVSCDVKLPFICGRTCKLSPLNDITLETWKKFKDTASWIPKKNQLNEHSPMTFIITTEKAVALAAFKSPVSFEILEEIVTNEPIYSIDFLLEKRILFWHRRSSTHIMMTTFDHNFPSRTLVKTNDEFTYISLDWITRNLFWICKGRQIISVTDVYGNKSMVLYLTDLDRPHTIQVDPLHGILFWIENVGIKAASMDRYSKYFKLVLPGNFNQLSIDVNNYNLYVSNGNQIKKYNYYETMVDDDVPNIDDIECFDTQVSVSTLDAKTVHTECYQAVCNGIFDYVSHIFLAIHNLVIGYFHFFQSSEESIFYIQNLLRFSEDIYSLRLLDIRKLTGNTSNPCSTNNKRCTQFCLASRLNKFTCVCPLDGEYLPARNDSCDYSVCSVDNGGCKELCHPQEHYPYRYCGCFDGYHLQLDKMCINENDTVHVLLYIENEKLIKAIPNGDSFELQQLELRDFVIYEDGGISIDPIDSILYWIRITENEFLVKGSFINGSGSFDVFTSSFETGSLTVDVIGRQIYLSLFGNSSIDSIKMDDFSHACVYVLEDKANKCFARTIQLDSFNGDIYFTQECSTRMYIDIRQVHFVANSVNVIVKAITERLHRISFGVDVKHGIIYWTSGASLTAIEYRAIHGTESGILVDEGQLIKFYDILIIDDRMYTTGYTGIGNINLRTKTGTLYQDGGFDMSIIGYSFSYRKGSFKTGACPTIAKCLGIQLRWICLSPEDVCDGIKDCYNYYDEMHCGLMVKNGRTTKIELRCSPLLIKHEYIYDNTTLSFASWDTHPFSNFIDISQIQNFECDIVYSVSNLELLQSFKLFSFYIYHRFRQIITSDVLRDTKYLQSFHLSGLGISKSWTDQSFLGYEHLLSLSLYHINMQILDNNVFQSLSKLLNLELRISALRLIEPGAFYGMMNCLNITFSETQIQVFPDHLFHNLSNLLTLDISYNRLIIIKDNTFEGLFAMRIIDIRGNDFHFSGRLFANNVNLQVIYSSTFSVCCVKPVHMPNENCISPPDFISGCENLVDNKLLRVSLWLFGILALIGNIASLIYRIRSEKGFIKDTFSILIANLAVSDSLMGLYLILIAIVDQYFRGTYMWNDYEWRNSLLCSALGILSFISMETSVFTISFITFARYLAVKYLFKEHRVSNRDAVIVSIVFWLISLSMALFPFLSFEGFYASSGLCVSLPLTKGTSAGWLYSFSLFIVFNFIIFIFIALAQGMIIYIVRKTSAEIQRTGPKKHIEVAKRVTPIIVTDCLCWIPIGTMGIMAISGYDMPKTVYAWTVVFVLPINSALNPILYTFDGVLRKVLTRVFEIMKRFTQEYGKYAFRCILVYFVTATVTMLMFQLFKMSEITKDHQEVYKPESYKLIRRDFLVNIYSINSKLQEKIANLTDEAREYETDMCTDYLVFGSNIRDVRITVSSSTGSDELTDDVPQNQLKFEDRYKTESCAWMPRVQDGYQYLQVEFDDDIKMKGIVIQWGLFSEMNITCFGYVGSFRVYYSSNCKDWILAPIGPFIQEYMPNTNNKPKRINFETEIQAKCVRFNPVNWEKNIAMRADIVRCYI